MGILIRLALLAAASAAFAAGIQDILPGTSPDGYEGGSVYGVDSGAADPEPDPGAGAGRGGANGMGGGAVAADSGSGKAIVDRGNAAGGREMTGSGADTTGGGRPAHGRDTTAGDSSAASGRSDVAGTTAPGKAEADTVGRTIAAERVGADTSAILELERKSSKASGSRVHRQKEVSRIRLSRSDLQKVVAAQGDPLKVLGTLPGVVNQNDLSVRPFVRGGKAEETQILWDGIALLQPYHFGTLYSIFNTESLQDMTLYSGGFPVESGNALSAAILMRSRPPPPDSLRLFADLSMLRGSAYAGVPLVKNRLAVSVSWQAFWYDWVINRGWDLADLFQRDSSFSAEKQEFRSLVQLPNFRDLQFGLAARINGRMEADYVGLVSWDAFRARDPLTRYYYRGREVSPQWYFDNEGRSGAARDWTQRKGFDTVANVAVDNQVHAVHFRWRPTENLDVDQAVAYQRQDWHVLFDNQVIWHDSIDGRGAYAGYREYAPSVMRLKLAKQSFDWNLDARWQWNPSHLARIGASQSTRVFDYDTRLLRPMFETIVNGSVDVTEGMSYLYPDGLVIREGDEGVFNENAQFVTSLPNLIGFDYLGRQAGALIGLYASDEWSPDARHRLTAGLRAETDTWSGGLVLSPRLAWFQNLGRKDELTFAGGLYTQSDFPFHQRDANPGLKPEKAVHLNAEWTHFFSDHYRLEAALYRKYYYDLAVPVLRNSGSLDWDSELLRGLDSALFEQFDEETRQAILNRLGVKELDYRTGGTGRAGGCEISFFYDPHTAWSGWISGEVAYSKRRDARNLPEYDFRYSRPWAFNWVNHFHMPSNYVLSLRARYAAGLPYSEYRFPDLPGQGAMGDTLFYLSPRNKARYSAYSRWDVRLEKEFIVKRHPMRFYTEVWNMFNTPNFIMRDGRTGQWKFFDANYPIPILFLGINWRW